MNGCVRTLDHNCNQAVISEPTVNVQGKLKGGKWNKTLDSSRRVYGACGVSPTIHTQTSGNSEIKILLDYKIRRLTPAECFRLMDFNKNFKWQVSDTQAYKQAGNSIVVACLVEIIKKLNL